MIPQGYISLAIWNPVNNIPVQINDIERTMSEITTNPVTNELAGTTSQSGTHYEITIATLNQTARAQVEAWSLAKTPVCFFLLGKGRSPRSFSPMKCTFKLHKSANRLDADSAWSVKFDFVDTDHLYCESANLLHEHVNAAGQKFVGWDDSNADGKADGWEDVRENLVFNTTTKEQTLRFASANDSDFRRTIIFPFAGINLTYSETVSFKGISSNTISAIQRNASNTTTLATTTQSRGMEGRNKFRIKTVSNVFYLRLLLVTVPATTDECRIQFPQLKVESALADVYTPY